MEGIEYIKQPLLGRQLAIGGAARVEEIDPQLEYDATHQDAHPTHSNIGPVRFTPGPEDSDDEGQLTFEGANPLL
jgi:hypothetical protein